MKSLKNRQELANWFISVYRDAISTHMTSREITDAHNYITQTRDYQRLTQVDRAYIRGYAESFYDHNVKYVHIESGSWVTMPDGAERWFGATSRLNSDAYKQAIADFPDLADYGIHRYVYEHSIPSRSGLYWLDKGVSNGLYPYFISEVTK
jgi:hypothetical protein